MNETGSRHRLVFSPHIDLVPWGEALWQKDDAQSPQRQRRISAVREALDDLTDKQREAVHLHFFEGLSQGEIARTLGVSQQVVQKRIYGTLRGGKRVGGALRKLKQALRYLFVPTETAHQDDAHCSTSLPPKTNAHHEDAPPKKA